MFRQLIITDIIVFILLSMLIFLLFGNLFYTLLKRLVGEMYCKTVYSLFGLDADVIHKINFIIFISISFYLLFAQTFINGYVLFVGNYLLMAIASAYFLICLFRQWRSLTYDGLSKYLLASRASFTITVLSLGIIIFQRFNIIQRQYGSTMDDALVHSYIVNRIFKTGLYQPAFDLKISYSFGSHTIASLLTFFLGEPIYQIVLLSTVLFSFLNFFAFYSLISTLNLKKTYRYFSAMFFTLFVPVSYTYINWGGLSSGTAIYLFVCTIAFSTKIFNEQATRYKKKFFIFSILIFGPLLVTYPPYMILVVFWLMVYPLFNSCSVRELLGSGRRILFLFPALTVTSISFFGYVLPTIYSFITGLTSRPPPKWLLGQDARISLTYVYNNMFSPTAFLNYKQLTEYLSISLFTHIPGFFDLVFYGVNISIFMIVLACLTKQYNNGSIQKISRLILLSYSFLVVVWGFNKLTFNYGISSVFFPVIRIIGMTSVFVALQYVLTIFLVLELVFASTNPLLHEPRKMYPSIVAIMLFILLFSYRGILIAETTYSQQWIDSNSALTLDDLTLQQWMKEHLPSNSTVLIQWSDGGQYIPLVTGLKTIYPYGLPPSFQENEVYQGILQTLSKGIDNPVLLLSTLKRIGVDYIYIGSRHFTKSPSPYVNAASLHPIPSFHFVHGVGNATLFKVLDEPSADFLFDDYANTTLSINIWHPVQGDWRMENETYVQYPTTMDVEPILSIASSITYSNFVFKTSIKIISEGEDQQQIGVVFRYQNEDNYYILRTRNSNEIRFRARENGEWTIFKSKNWIGETDKWYRFMIVAEGPRIQMFLDGEKLFDIVDTTFTQGQVGLMTWYTHGAFDNVCVFPLE